MALHKFVTYLLKTLSQLLTAPDPHGACATSGAQWRHLANTTELPELGGPCKNGSTDRDAVTGMDSGEPKDPSIKWGPDGPMSRRNF